MWEKTNAVQRAAAEAVTNFRIKAEAKGQREIGIRLMKGPRLRLRSRKMRRR